MPTVVITHVWRDEKEARVVHAEEAGGHHHGGQQGVDQADLTEGEALVIARWLIVGLTIRSV